jgi:hypothetical protein
MDCLLKLVENNDIMQLFGSRSIIYSKALKCQKLRNFVLNNFYAESSIKFEIIQQLIEKETDNTNKANSIPNYSETIEIDYSKQLKDQLEKKIEILKKKFSETNVQLVWEGISDLKYKVDSTNKNNFDKVVKMIKTWKVFYRGYYLNNASINMDQIKCEILNEFSEPSVNIDIKPNKIGVSSLDPNRCADVIKKIKTFITNKIANN